MAVADLFDPIVVEAFVAERLNFENIAHNY
jgi:response regulator RpfG family c-di-GMP phosphodiesterase